MYYTLFLFYLQQNFSTDYCTFRDYPRSPRSRASSDFDSSQYKKRDKHTASLYIYLSVHLPVGSCHVGDANAFSPKIRPTAFLLPVSFRRGTMHSPGLLLRPLSVSRAVIIRFIYITIIRQHYRSPSRTFLKILQ